MLRIFLVMPHGGQVYQRLCCFNSKAQRRIALSVQEEIETMFKYQGQMFSELGEEGALEEEEEVGSVRHSCQI